MSMVEIGFWFSVVVMAISIPLTIVGSLASPTGDKRLVNGLSALFNTIFLLTLWNLGEIAGIV